MNNKIQEFDSSFLLQAPVLINWNYTYRCHLNCSHCYSRTCQDGMELSSDEKMIVLDNIINNQVFFVNFGGGECLLDPFVLNAIERLSSVGTFTSLSTSGWGFSDDIWDRLKAVGLNRISLSLDAPTAEYHDAQRRMKGVFQAALKCLDYCVAVHLPVYLSTVLTKSNLPLMDKLLQLAFEHCCQGVDIKRLRLVGNGQKLQNQSLNESEEKALFRYIPNWKKKYAPMKIQMSYHFQNSPGIDDGCLCGKKLLTIRSNGDISACAYSPTILGNALIDDIGDIWRNHPVLQKMRQSGSCMSDAF